MMAAGVCWQGAWEAAVEAASAKMDEAESRWRRVVALEEGGLSGAAFDSAWEAANKAWKDAQDGAADVWGPAFMAAWNTLAAQSLFPELGRVDWGAGEAWDWANGDDGIWERVSDDLYNKRLEELR